MLTFFYPAQCNFYSLLELHIIKDFSQDLISLLQQSKATTMD